MDGSGLRAAGTPGAQDAAGPDGHHRARPLLAGSDRQGRVRRDGPDPRPRRGDPPDHRRADAAAAEQSDPHRRGRRRQDRGGRRLRAAHRRRRRAAAAARREALRARHRPDAGRRLDEGRVRAAPALGHRRGADLADADHPVHRRGAYADRRRRRGRHRRCRQPAQAGAGARHAAHHRRDHLVGIPPVLREGPGADPALPADPGRRAGRRALLRHAARHPRADGEAPQGAHLRRRDRRGGEAVAPLHSGAAVARQGGEPARHRLRARRDQPDRRRRR